jgi:hypothetical protein
MNVVIVDDKGSEIIVLNAQSVQVAVKSADEAMVMEYRTPSLDMKVVEIVVDGFDLSKTDVTRL